jgi:carbamoyltransferase
MIVLGIHTGHDASLSLMRDGKLVSAIAVERLSRRKKDDVISREVFDKFLEKNNISAQDIDVITMGYWNSEQIPFMSIYSPFDIPYPLSTFGTYHKQSILLSGIDPTFTPTRVEGLGWTLPPYIDRITPPYSNGPIPHTAFAKLSVIIDGVDKVFDGYFVDHHTSHAAYAFYLSPFDESMIFTADASMHDHMACSSMQFGWGNQINRFKNPQYMYGNFYDVATEYCGLGPGVIKAGVLMGLAAYGQVSPKTKKNWKKWTKPMRKRNEEFDFIYVDWLWSQISGKFPKIWYPREVKKDEDNFYTRPHQYVYTKKQSDTKEVMNIAADVQYMAERSLVKYSQDLYEESKSFNKNLCSAGGIFLNCNANYKIITESGFDNFFLAPACGDDGVSIGSSLFVYHHVLLNDKQTYKNNEIMYLGFDYDYQPQSKYSAIDLDLDKVAELISEGKIVCWFQGRSEFGPRALGNRSFITDPRRKEMKDILNSRVKFREWYRPFAPVVLNEDKEEWFDMNFESPFMLFTVPCKKPQDIPSAVHIDSTARVQTLRREDNETFYDLIDKFKQITGVPVVMNTSLNIKGEPIVETPEDAMKLFEESDVDVLVINDKMYFK